MEQFAQYGHAIVAMAGLAIFQLILSPLSAMQKTRAGTGSGGPARAGLCQCHISLAPCLWQSGGIVGPFVAVTVAAMLAGANPFWVNPLASVFLVMRIVLAVGTYQRHRQTGYERAILHVCGGLAHVSGIGRYGNYGSVYRWLTATTHSRRAVWFIAAALAAVMAMGGCAEKESASISTATIIRPRKRAWTSRTATVCGDRASGRTGPGWRARGRTAWRFEILSQAFRHVRD